MVKELLTYPTSIKIKYLDETKKNIARDQDLDSLLTLLQFEQMEIRYLASEIIQGLSVNGTTISFAFLDIFFL